MGRRPAVTPDDGTYMTVDEFAALTSSQQHAVWAACPRKGRQAIDTIPVGTIQRYHRAQVQALLAQAAAR